MEYYNLNCMIGRKSDPATVTILPMHAFDSFHKLEASFSLNHFLFEFH